MSQDRCPVCSTRAPKFLCSGCREIRYCSQTCQLSHWTSHHKACKEIQGQKQAAEKKDAVMKQVVALAQAKKPLVTLTGRLDLSTVLDPVEHISLSLPTLEAYQGTVVVGKLLAPSVLKELKPSLVGRVELIVSGTKQGTLVPVEIIIHPPASGEPVLPGLADALQLCVSQGTEDPIDLAEQCSKMRDGHLLRLRCSTLHSVIFASNRLVSLPGPEPVSVPPLVLQSVMAHLSMRDICSMTMVCQSWREAVDANVAFWDGLIWWNEYCFVNVVCPETRTGLAAWVDSLLDYSRLVGRRKVLSMLSLPNCCSCCGSPLSGRPLIKAEKLAAGLREYGSLNHVARLCGGCSNEFVIPLQTIQSSFSELSRGDLAGLFSFKVDGRKSHLRSQCAEATNRRNELELEALAAKNGLNPQLMWERLHPRYPTEAPDMAGSSKANLDALIGPEDDDQDEEDDLEEHGGSGSNLVRVWFPINLVYEQEGEQWTPFSRETFTRRNLEILLQLGLIQQMERTATRVAFVETLDAPVPETITSLDVNAMPLEPRRRAVDDEEAEFEVEDSDSDDGSSDSEAFLVKEDPKKRGRTRVHHDDDDDGDDDEFNGSDNDEVIIPRGTSTRQRRVKLEPGSVGVKALEKAKPKPAERKKKKTDETRPGMPRSYHALVQDPDLLAFLNLFGITPEPDLRYASYKLCRALYDSKHDVKETAGDRMLRFSAGDLLVVAFWMQKRSWSVFYNLTDPYDYHENRRKYGWAPHNYVKVIEKWTVAEMQRRTDPKLGFF